MEPMDVRVKVVSGHDNFGVRKNTFITIHKNEEGKIHFDELEGLFNFTDYTWEPPKNAKLSFLDGENNTGFTIEIVCDKELSSKIVELAPVTAFVVEPKEDASQTKLVESHLEAPESKMSIFSIVGMIVGAIFSVYGITSLLATLTSPDYKNLYGAMESFKTAAITLNTAIFLFGILIVCYFGNHLHNHTKQ